ncbi:uncharacterized histidine-rich protein DDB_G0274557-like [Thrips palmi]|uniref:Uncharacterized histidine-rich protein DDB_G0274557-like n=1 Tax=Thrips palmi TaxID=161013 RepID=A0A6P9A0Y2_THRPL|nr:uncharacterized histidine-rich protein DDB_G0274557-like [Thrips palmi]
MSMICQQAAGEPHKPNPKPNHLHKRSPHGPHHPPEPHHKPHSLHKRSPHGPHHPPEPNHKPNHLHKRSPSGIGRPPKPKPKPQPKIYAPKPVLHTDLRKNGLGHLLGDGGR